ncbi:MAG: nucleotide exchange factor GrpE [Deltaproteobacteria bacterium]|nr:nucleotide exchange factor GrpE [Deltaproteobacteria bacterium]
MSPEDQPKPEPPDAPAPESELEQVKAALAQKEGEAKEHYDRYLRAAADLDNFRKRSQRERAELMRFAQEPLIRDLLPVVDNLERAVSHAQGGGDGQQLIEGVSLVLLGLLDLLAKHGVARIDAGGQLFDPARHEALARVELPDEEPNRVVEQYQPGYLLHERLLRAAQVTVSARPCKPVANGENDD